VRVGVIVIELVGVIVDVGIIVGVSLEVRVKCGVSVEGEFVCVSGSLVRKGEGVPVEMGMAVAQANDPTDRNIKITKGR